MQASTGLWVGLEVSVGNYKEARMKTRMKILAALSFLLLCAGLGLWFYAEQLAAYFSG